MTASTMASFGDLLDHQAFEAAIRDDLVGGAHQLAPGILAPTLRPGLGPRIHQISMASNHATVSLHTASH
jgi:hypothetical protein